MWWQPMRADNYEDEKRLFRAEKEVERKQQQKRKRKHNPTMGTKNHAIKASGSEIPPGRGGNMGSKPAPSRPRLIGPCWRCGEIGHLAASCTKQRPVNPFNQPQVSEATDGVVCLIDASDNERGGLDSFGHKSVSVNVKLLSELCKLAILGNVPSSVQGVNDGLSLTHAGTYVRLRSIFQIHLIAKGTTS